MVLMQILQHTCHLGLPPPDMTLKSMKLAHTSLNTALDYKIQQHSSSFEKNPKGEMCETSVLGKAFYKLR